MAVNCFHGRGRYQNQAEKKICLLVMRGLVLLLLMESTLSLAMRSVSCSSCWFSRRRVLSCSITVSFSVSVSCSVRHSGLDFHYAILIGHARG